MLCEGVSSLAVHADGLEEEESEESTEGEKCHVASKGAEDQLNQDDETQADKFVASVRQELEEWRRLAATCDAKEIETSLENEGFKEPEAKGFCVDVAKDIRSESI